MMVGTQQEIASSSKVETKLEIWGVIDNVT